MAIFSVKEHVVSVTGDVSVRLELCMGLLVRFSCSGAMCYWRLVVVVGCWSVQR